MQQDNSRKSWLRNQNGNEKQDGNLSMDDNLMWGGPSHSQGNQGNQGNPGPGLLGMAPPFMSPQQQMRGGMNNRPPYGHNPYRGGMGPMRGNNKMRGSPYGGRGGPRGNRGNHNRGFRGGFRGNFRGGF